MQAMHARPEPRIPGAAGRLRAQEFFLMYFVAYSLEWSSLPPLPPPVLAPYLAKPESGEKRLFARGSGREVVTTHLCDI